VADQITNEEIGELDLGEPAIDIFTKLVSIMDVNKQTWIQVGFIDQFNEQIILEINICARGTDGSSTGGNGSASN